MNNQHLIKLRAFGELADRKAKAVLTLLLITLYGMGTYAQIPIISYQNPQVYTMNTAITQLNATNTGAAAAVNGQTITFAGSGTAGWTDARGVSASFNQPLGSAVDAAGNIYIADAGTDVIRKISPSGLVQTIAGAGYAGFADGTGNYALFNHPVGLAVDAAGNVYVADEDNYRIRKITPLGVVTTVAGSGSPGNANGGVTVASFNLPCGVAVDPSGNIYVADYNNNQIRFINVATQMVSVFAGGGTVGSNNASGINATFNHPFSVCIDGNGYLYVADRLNELIRKITPAGLVSTLAGTTLYTGSYNGMGGAASFYTPTTVTVDKSGNVFVADESNDEIREISPSGSVSTLSGIAGITGSNNGVGSASTFYNPFTVAVDATGNVYVGDYSNSLIRKVVSTPFTITPSLPTGLVFNPSTGAITGTPSVASPATDYTITAYNAAGDYPASLNITVKLSGGINPGPNANSLVIFTPLVNGYTSASSLLPDAANITKMQTNIQYFDGLGRPSQTVDVKASPTSKDVVQIFSYDQFSRQALKYLPYSVPAAAPSDGSFKTTAVADQLNFYDPPGATGSQLPGGIPIINTPYSGTNFEQSPLNRDIEQGAPGSTYQLGSGHTVKTQYGTNIASEVIDWELNSAANGAVGTSYYGAGQLDVVTTTDENGHNAIEYRDKQNHLVCKKEQNATLPAVTYAATYYVYDNWNNTCYVIPPIPASVAYPTSFLETDAVYLNYIYGYHYDGRNRVATKKIPGRTAISYVYNSLDQQVASQEGDQVAANQWTFKKFDGEGHLIMTGIWNAGSAMTQAQLQNLITTSYNSQLWEVFVSGSYTNGAWPTGSVATVLTENFYGTYSVTGMPSYTVPSIANTTTTMINNRVTVSETNVLGTGTMLWAVNYYDIYGHLITKYKQHYLASAQSTYNYDAVSYGYNFANTLSGTTRKHYSKNTGGTASLIATVVNSYVYDNQSRKTRTFEQINSAPQVLLFQEDYNEVGKSIARRMHSINSGANFLQNVDYRYNSRGWLTDINNATLQNDFGVTNSDVNDLFGMEVSYDATTTTDPQYNGNIATEKWQNAVGATGLTAQTFTYDFRYDNLNRVTEAVSSTNGVKDKHYSEYTSYDKLGNILTIGRHSLISGAPTQIDSLTYTYTGNQATRIDDMSGNNTYGFNDGVKQANEYLYDNDGNAYTDLNKGITNIGFNVLNLPTTYTAGTTTVTYTYDAQGNKLSKKTVSGSSTTLTEYIDGFEYDQSVLSTLATDAGRARWNGSVFNYEYDIQDNLGTVRTSFSANPSDPTQQTAQIIQMDQYYPFGYNFPQLSFVSGVKLLPLYKKGITAGNTAIRLRGKIL